MKINRNETKGLLFGFLGVALFSLTLPMTRLAVVDFGPVPLAVWRGFLASIFAIVTLLIMRPPLPGKQDWPMLCLCASGTVFGFPVFITFAMETVPASQGAVVVGLLPLATAVAGVFIGKERPSLLFWLVSLAGTVVTLMFVLRQAEGSLVIAHIYLFLAVITSSIGYAYGGKAAKKLGGWQVACWSLVTAFPILVLGAFWSPTVSFVSVGPMSIVAFFYLALISQFIGFFVWYRGMALAGIVRVSQVQLLQLFMSVIAAIFLLGEPFDVDIIMFGSLVVALVWFGTRLRVAAKS